MVLRGRVVGAIYLDTHDSIHRFGEKERTFVEALASQAAVAIENARLFGQMRSENIRLQREVEGRFKEVIGSSPAMRRVHQVMEGVLNNDSTVLLTGESGTGKGMVARAIHANGHRQQGPFIAVDCGALPDNLLEAELFGYRRGAFTGADQDRTGLVEEARGGTLFLDEIGNTSPGFQARLLRLLQEKEIRRLGENEARPVNVRIIAATNADLRSLMQDGKFRQDLFYRLNVVSIEVPPLRNRLEDLTTLVDHFIRRHASQSSQVKRLGPGVLRAFGQYSWPGNVRELEHVLERLLLLTPGEFITLDDLPDELRPTDAAPAHGDVHDEARRAGKHPGPRSIDSPKTGEQLMIEDALRRYAGDKAKAARFIGWNRQKLYRRMRSFSIPAGFGHKKAA
jgi:transcriptional regulator with PAS, ATPase and Fis domain